MSRGFRGIPRISATFFWERDDRLGPLQLPLQPAVLPLELLYPGIARLGHRPALARPPGDELALLALATPRGHMRGVQAFAAQQRPELAGLLARIGLLHDPQPILGREPAALDLRRHFRIGVGRA